MTTETKTEQETIHDLTFFYTNKTEGSASSKVEEGSLKDIEKDRKAFVLKGTMCINEDKSAKATVCVMMLAVESSNVGHIGYQMDNKNHGYFYILFLGKGKEPSLYVYYDVKDTTVLEANDADSIGKYVNQHIKPTYSFDKLL